MRFAWVGCLVFASSLAAGTQDADCNVNTRYKVETIIVSGHGWSTDFASSQDKKISPGLGKRISALIGDQLNPAALDDVTRRLRKELQASVTRHMERGGSPEYVKVVFQVGETANNSVDGSVTKFSYNSKQGWSGAAQSAMKTRQNAFTFGVVSDGDELAERYAGVMARYDNTRIGSDRVRLRFEFDSYHDQWNPATLHALPTGAGALNMTSDVYRTRQNFEPAITIELAEPLTVTVGTSFERFQNAFPAAHTEAANAVVAAVRYHQRMEGSEAEQDLDAGYSLRAATKVFDSDFVYARHELEFQYTLTHGRHVFRDRVSAGIVTGTAPLYERYELGNSRSLRGWNKFEIDPIGGNRMVHNSVEYRYGVFEMFYDAGAVWDEGRQAATPRHGIGLGLRHGPFELAMAFPIRSGRADPVFMMGMNY